MDTALPLTPVDATTLRAWWSAGAWHRLTPYLRAIGYKRLPHGFRLAPDDADDIISTMVVRCWTLPHVPDDPTNFAVAMVRNLCLDHLKKHHNAKKDEGADVGALIGHEPDALDAIVRQENMTRLRLALSQLAEPLRRALVLHDLHHRTCADIGVQLGLNEGAVKMRLHRARRVLGEIYMRTLPSLDAAPSTPAPRFARPLHSTRLTLAPHCPPPPHSAPEAPVPLPVFVEPLCGAPTPKKRGRPVVHRCRCGDEACRVYSERTAPAPSPAPAPALALAAPSGSHVPVRLAHTLAQLMGGAP